MSIIARLVIIGILLAAAVTAVLAYNNAIAKSARLEKELQAIAKERDNWIEVAAQEATAKQLADKALVNREVERNRLLRQRDDANAQIAELRRQAEVAKWADMPIPESVRDWLRDDGGKSPSTDSPKAVPPKSPARSSRLAEIQWDVDG